MAITLQQLTQLDTNYIGKHNANYTAIQSEINNILTQYQSLSAKSQPGGYAGLGSDGKVPTSQLPDLGVYQLRAEKGAALGYPSLDATGKVPTNQLPAALLSQPGNVDLTPYQLKVEKGQSNGYASLDGGSKVPAGQLPDLSGTYQVASGKGQANGYAGLGADGKVPSSQLPDSSAQLYIATGYVGGRPGNGALMSAILPTVAATFAAGFVGSRAKVGVPATAETVLLIKKNGSQVGTITFSAGGTAGTFAAASPVSAGAGDELTIENQVTADTTFADFRFALHGTR